MSAKHDTGFLPPALQTETVLRISFRHNRSHLPSLTSTFRARAWGFGIIVLAMHLEGSMEAGMTAQLLLHVEKKHIADFVVRTKLQVRPKRHSHFCLQSVAGGSLQL